MKNRKSSHENNLLIYQYNFTIAVYSVNKERSYFNKCNYNYVFVVAILFRLGS